MEGQPKTESSKLLDKGSFGTHSKPLAGQIGLEAAVILNFLIYKYDYFKQENKLIKGADGANSFFITYKDIEEETSIKATKLGRIRDSNPIIILQELGLLTKTTIQTTHIKTTYYTLHFDKIALAYDNAIKYLDDKRKQVKIARELKLSLLLDAESAKIDEFLKNNLNLTKTGLNPSDSLILPIGSTHTATTTSPIQPNPHITNKLIPNNKPKKKKLTSKDALDDSEISDEFLNEILGDGYNVPDQEILNDNSEADLEIDDEALFGLIKNVRRGVKTPEDFFEAFVNDFLRTPFKGFNMSPEDGLLILNSITNNPLFVGEDEYIQRQIEGLREDNEDISDEELEAEIDYDDDKYDQHYNRLWEKILLNTYKIKEGALDTRFGSLFVGVQEMSRNYADAMDNY